MARIEDRRKAIQLRMAGNSFTYRQNYLNFPKGTLHYWIKDIQLTREQLERIKKNSKAKRIENYLKTVRERRQKIFQWYINGQREALLPLTKKDFLIAGLFLYLGEGTKSSWWTSVLTNSDPSIIKFWIFWLTKIIGVSKDKKRFTFLQ